MATGDRRTVNHPGADVAELDFLVDQVGTTSGQWQDVKDIGTLSIEIRGIVGDTVQIFGRNSLLQPANSVDGTKIGSDISADTHYVLAAGLRLDWVKVKVSAAGTGTIQAFGRGTR